MRNYPDFIKAYLEYTDNHEASEHLRTWISISVLAGALQRRAWYDFDYYRLYPNLYIIVVGKSGLVKKSTAMGIGVDLLRDLNIPIMSERVTATSLIREIKASQTWFEIDKKKINQAAVYAYASELKASFGSHVSSVSELLTDFYDCNPHDSSKPWVNKSSRDKTAIYGPCLNLLAGTTPKWLTRMIPADDMEGGFASRILFVVENQSDKVVAWPELTDDRRKMRHYLVHDLKRIQEKCVGRVRVSTKARELFTAWYENHMKVEVPKNDDPKFSGYLGRKGDTIRKLALLRACSLSEDMVVDHEHIIWACEMAEKLEKNMFSAIQVFKEEDTMHDILEYVRSRGKSDIKEICAAFSVRASEVAIRQMCVDLRIAGIFQEFKADSTFYYAFVPIDGPQYDQEKPLSNPPSHQSSEEKHQSIEPESQSKPEPDLSSQMSQIEKPRNLLELISDQVTKHSL